MAVLLWFPRLETGNAGGVATYGATGGAVRRARSQDGESARERSSVFAGAKTCASPS